MLKKVRVLARQLCFGPLLLMALSIQPASAQTPMLTNADVTHLVAMHVSDQTVISVIQEATATQFDLSAGAVSDLTAHLVPTAVIAAMRQPSARNTKPTNETALAQPSSTAAARTLAGAAAAAAAAPHTWPLSTPSSPAPSAPASTSSAKSSPNAAPASTAPVSTASASTAPVMTPRDLENRRWACVTSLTQDSHLSQGEAVGACKINSSKEYYLCVYGLANDAQVDGNYATNACFKNRSRDFINCVYQAAKNLKGDKRAVVDMCLNTIK
jgi:hypothetical protein